MGQGEGAREEEDVFPQVGAGICCWAVEDTFHGLVDSDEDGKGLPHMSEGEGFADVVGPTEEEELSTSGEDGGVGPARGEVEDLEVREGGNRCQGGPGLEVPLTQRTEVALFGERGKEGCVGKGGRWWGP